jgi:Rrf2 family protein
MPKIRHGINDFLMLPARYNYHSKRCFRCGGLSELSPLTTGGVVIIIGAQGKLVMKSSTKSDYACRAIEALALHHPDTEPVCIDEIARQRAIPANYLVQILLELKRNGLIQSHRGKMGGYVLAKAPQEISLGDVLRAVHGEVLDLPHLADAACPEEIKRAWRRVKLATEGAADNITFDQICAEARNPALMYHI